MWVWVVILSILYTEFVGYVVHRLLHSGKIPWLHELHMEHHEEHYPPGSNQLSDTYRYIDRKTWLDNIGWEWVLPIAIVVIPTGVLLFLFGVSIQHLLAAVMISLLWTWAFLDYAHKLLHVKNTWIENNYVLKNWFKEVRRLHYIHHNDMTTNFGIAFFWYDKLYETFTRKLKNRDQAA